MGIDFHALTIPRALFEKYRGTPKLPRLWDMKYFYFDAEGDDELLMNLAEGFVEDDDEEHPEVALAELRELIEARHFPTASMSLGKEWRTLDETLEDLQVQLPILGKCFHSGETLGTDREIDALGGDDLQKLVAALRKVRLAPADGVDDDEVDVRGFAEVLAEVRAFYETAAANDQTVLRGLF